MSENMGGSVKPTWITSCKGCVFALWDGNRQTGCSFDDRLSRFKEAGIRIVETRDETDNVEHFVVESICEARRSENVVSETGDALKARVREEIAVRFDAVVCVVGPEYGGECEDKQEILRKVLSTVEAFRTGKRPPERLSVAVVGFPKGFFRPDDFRVFLPDHWSVRFVLEKIDGGFSAAVGRCVDLCVADSSSRFHVAVTKPGWEPPPEFLSEIDRAVVDRMERFVLLESVSSPPLPATVVSTFAHRILGGNAPAELLLEEEPETPSSETPSPSQERKPTRVDSIRDKIRHRVNIEGRKTYIRSLEETCPSLATKTAEVPCG